MSLFVDTIATPIGALRIVWEDDTLRALDFGDDDEKFARLLEWQFGTAGLPHAQAPREIRQAFEQYFAGDLTAIDRIKVNAIGTPFQQQVWAALREIPAGTTTSYGKLAERLGRPGASRAVGLANGSNPVGVVVPCHRVIGANGSLTGYGGGLDRKRWLLEHERAGLLALSESRK